MWKVGGTKIEHTRARYIFYVCARKFAKILMEPAPNCCANGSGNLKKCLIRLSNGDGWRARGGGEAERGVWSILG